MCMCRAHTSAAAEKHDGREKRTLTLDLNNSVSASEWVLLMQDLQWMNYE